MMRYEESSLGAWLLFDFLPRQHHRADQSRQQNQRCQLEREQISIQEEIADLGRRSPG